MVLVSVGILIPPAVHGYYLFVHVILLPSLLFRAHLEVQGLGFGAAGLERFLTTLKSVWLWNYES